MAPFTMTVHSPCTQSDREALARQVACIHAQAASRRIQALTCPSGQKLALLDAVLDASRKQP